MAASYLPHLDGIRAIALAGVILFHFDVHPFQGGYVGVDIFLTLSGYLITRNIGIALHSKSGFSIRNFYVRRFFRLYPASLVCTLVSALLAVAMFPADLALQTFKSALASLASAANIYFYLTTGYFDLTARHKPLLHHWSLSLEEQFYVVWPPLLMLVVQCVPRLQTRILTGTLTMLIITSFACAVALSHRFSSFTFFMLPTRIFQFAVGALYAIANWPRAKHATPAEIFNASMVIPSVSVPMPSTISAFSRIVPLVSNLFSALALVVMIASYVLLPSNARPQHVAPVSFATLVLIALQNSMLASRLLSSRFLGFFGRISYSAYLVHWPIYVFLRYAAPALKISSPSPIFHATLTFACALVLYHGVEQPFRKPKLAHRVVVLALLTITILLCKRGLRDLRFRGVVQDYHSTGLPAFEKRGHLIFRGSVDVTKQVTTRNFGNVVRAGAIRNGTRSNFVFIGDSFTNHLRDGLNVLGNRHNVWFQLHSMPGCPFWPDSYYIRSKRPHHRCRKQIGSVWKELPKLPAGSTIVVGNLWCDEPLEGFKSVVLELSDMVKKNGGHKLAILGEPPGLSRKEQSYFSCAFFWQLPMGRMLTSVRRVWSGGRTMSRSDGTACANIRKGLEPDECQAVRALEMRAHLQKARHIGFIDVWSALCGDGKKDWGNGAVCKLPVYFDDKVLYNVGYMFDGTHYSAAGSYYVGMNIIGRFIFGKGSVSPKA